MKPVDNMLPTTDLSSLSSTQGEGGKHESPWYWVAATYKSVHIGVSRKRHVWQRIVFLIRALDEDEAAIIAHQVALAKEHEYLVDGGDTLRWVFQEIEEIHGVFDREIGQGTEVYWEFFERVDGTAGSSNRGKHRSRQSA
jgi:hypothetical protein